MRNLRLKPMPFQPSRTCPGRSGSPVPTGPLRRCGLLPARSAKTGNNSTKAQELPSRREAKRLNRPIGNFAILTTFDNQLATISGLYPDERCDANRVCTYPSNGARWSDYESVYYTSPDCTGLPYSLAVAMGTPYLGVPVVDSGGAYLYFFKAVDMTRVTLRSGFSNNACFQMGIRGASPTDAAPVSDVAPASNFGIAPFFLK